MGSKGILIARVLLSCLALCLLPSIGSAAESRVPLQRAPIDLTDPASLQRGAMLYMNYCAGCHSLKFTRYETVAKDIGITDEKGDVYDDIVKESMLFVGTKLTDPILTAMPKEDAMNWFGIVPPDLSLVSRSRGVDWLYTYLKSFYKDPTKTWGVNNLVFPDVGMPHVLADLQGVQALRFQTVGKIVDGNKVEQDVVEALEIVESGRMNEVEYDQAVTDLVNFLSYVGEPIQLQRKRLGIWVLAFLGVFLIFSFLLKREYWKGVH